MCIYDESVDVERWVPGAFYCDKYLASFPTAIHFLRCAIFLLENEYTNFRIFLQWANEKKEINFKYTANVLLSVYEYHIQCRLCEIN